MNDDREDWVPRADAPTAERVAYLEEMVRLLRLDLHDLARLVDSMRKQQPGSDL